MYLGRVVLLLLIMSWQGLAHAESKTTDEVIELVRREIAKLFTRCGDSHYVLYEPSGGLRILHEVKGLTTGDVFEEELDDLDRINGYEWSGSVVVVAKMSRALSLNNEREWSDWRHGLVEAGFNNYWTVRLEKKKGQWIVGDLSPLGTWYKPIACDRVRAESPIPDAREPVEMPNKTIEPTR